MKIQRAHDWCLGTLLRRLFSVSDKLYRVFQAYMHGEAENLQCFII